MKPNFTLEYRNATIKFPDGSVYEISLADIIRVYYAKKDCLDKLQHARKNFELLPIVDQTVLIERLLSSLKWADIRQFAKRIKYPDFDPPKDFKGASVEIE